MNNLWIAKQKVLALKVDLEKKSALYELYRKLCSDESYLLNSLKKEEKDLQILKGFTLTSIIETIKRTKESTREKEIEAYNQAKAAYENCLKEKENTLEAIEALEQKCELEEMIYQEYENIFEQTICQLKKTDGLIGDNVRNMDGQLSQIELELNQIAEAQTLQVKIHDYFIEYVSTLNDVVTYYTLEMTGGDMWASILKKERLEASYDKSKQIKLCIELFEKNIRNFSVFTRLKQECLEDVIEKIDVTKERLESANILYSEIEQIISDTKSCIQLFDSARRILEKHTEEKLEQQVFFKLELEKYLLKTTEEQIA